MTRPFDDFRTAITDPDYFFGRTDFLKTMFEAPFQVYILLGGRRIGKTSTLRSLEWNFLNPGFQGDYRAFPVIINLQVEQPQSPDNFRYILSVRLREAIDRWQHIKLSALKETYSYYLRQVSSAQIKLGSFLSLTVNNPDQERQLIHDDFRYILLKSLEELRKLKFDGICFLLDEAEFAVKKEWSNDVWSYLRGVKDADTALKSFLGFVLSGYRDLKNYEQQVGSPLFNIANTPQWLSSLSEAEAQELITFRAKKEAIQLTEKGINHILELTGFHPFLTQQLLNILFDSYHAKKSFSLDFLLEEALRQQEQNFSNWWNAKGDVDGFGDDERTVYHALINQRQGTCAEFTKITGLSMSKVKNALQVLLGTGVIRKIDEVQYTISGKLFEQWVRQL